LIRLAKLHRVAELLLRLSVWRDLDDLWARTPSGFTEFEM
jgi:hypothetical protein